MCGIAGFADAARIGSDGDRGAAALVHDMCEVIRHRGPDDEGIHVEPGVGLGMRRLSIIDLSTGHQPIHNEDRTIWVVFNGEIYNYRELRTELERAGHCFYTSSDTETIVHAYEAWGEEAFERLRGMFGIALVGSPAPRVVRRTGPRRDQADLLRGRGRTAILRLRDQVAAGCRRRSHARSRRARPLPDVPLHAPRWIDLSRHSQAPAWTHSAVAGRSRHGQAVLAAASRGKLLRDRG